MLKPASEYKQCFEILKQDEKLQNPDSSLIILRKIEDEARESGDSAFVAKILSFKGGKYYAKGDYLNSLKSCKSSLRIFKFIKDEVEIAKSYNNLGIIYEVTGDYEFAIENYEKSLEIWKGITNPALMKEVKTAIPHVYSNLGVVYENSGNQTLAMKYYKKGLVLASETNQISAKSFLLLNIGLVYSRSGNLDSAKYYLDNSLEISRIINDKFQIANTLNNFGLIFQREKNPDSAQYYFIEALKIGKQINALELVKNSYHGLYECSEAKGRYKEANKYLKLYKLLEDSIYNAQSIRGLSEMKDQIKEESKPDAEISLTKFLLLTIFLIVAILIVTILVMKRYRDKKLERISNSAKLIEEIDDEIKNDDQNSKFQISYQVDETIVKQVVEKLNYAISEKKIHRDKNLTLELLAKEIGCSRSRISNVINQEYGKNFNNWINEFRIADAKDMMRNPGNKNLTIEAISQQVGFNSKSTFNTFFKAATGITPSQYIEIQVKDKL